MGKISDALKKVMNERQEQKKIQMLKLKEEAVKIREKEKAASYKTKSETAAFKPTLKDKLESLKYEEFYVARAKDTSGIDPRIVTYFDHSSPVVEQYKILRTNLKSYLLKAAKSKSTTNLKSVNSPKIVAVTSSLHSEGKTVTCVNLAVSLAKNPDTKVLLIDCDLRNGMIHGLLGIDSVPGLTEVLTADYDYSVALHPTKMRNLFVIPRGKPPANPAELLDSKKMQLILEQLKVEPLTYVIIDTPPVITFTDASVICSKADAVALVVQAHRTQEQVVRRAKDLIQQAHGKFLGFILTQTDYYIPDLYSYYYYYRYKKHNQS